MKRAFKIKQKAFFINFERLSLKDICLYMFGKWESDNFKYWLRFAVNRVDFFKLKLLGVIDHSVTACDLIFEIPKKLL